MILNFSKLKENNKYFSKEEILRIIDQRVIYEHYLGQSIDFKTNIKSPLRKDNNPSFQFFKSRDGVLYGKDWGTGELYNCFDFIQEKYRLTFPESLKVITNDFNLNKNDRQNFNRNTIVSSSGSMDINLCEYEETRKKTKITIREQPFTRTDIEYWNPLELEDLVDEVISCKYVFSNNRLIKFYTNEKPVYAYKYVIENEVFYKIYCPTEQRQYKWMYSGDKSIIDGYDKLPEKGDLLFLTKSRKDRLFLKKLGFIAVSLHSETIMLEKEDYDKIKERFKEIIIFYDNDKAGRNMSNKIANIYNLQEIFIPEDLYCKDISEIAKMYGLDYAKDLINSLI